MTKLICMYLPQFHEFSENNEWWGKGFTEWSCVDRAVEICHGHKIKKPHPDIGRYDLRNPETRRLQALMAKDSKIAANNPMVSKAADFASQPKTWSASGPLSARLGLVVWFIKSPSVQFYTSGQALSVQRHPCAWPGKDSAKNAFYL